MLLRLRLDGWVWKVFNGMDLVSEIHLDWDNQVKEVVLYTVLFDIQIRVIRLAASHVKQFALTRTTDEVISWMQMPRRILTLYDSHRLMDFDLIPKEIEDIDIKALVAELKKVKIRVLVDAEHAQSLD